MKYQFQKLYVDLIAEDGTVCIAYLAQTRLTGITYPHAGLELYRPDGRREVIRAKIPKEATLPPLDSRFHLDVPGGSFSVVFDTTHGDWTPTPAPTEGLDWCVLFARAQGSVCWKGHPARSRLHGTGYADRVALRRLPRRFGLRRLDWGRIHWRHRTLVFNAIRFRTGASWKRTACWSPNGFFETDIPFELVEADGTTHLVLPDQTFTLKPVRVLHEGPALDPVRFPNPLEHLIARAAAGPVREARWLSRVEDPLAPQSPAGWALHECVHFD